MTATATPDVQSRIDAFRAAYAARKKAADNADAAFARYFRKREAGEPTNGAAWQRLENEANYLSADLQTAADRLYAVDIDPTNIEPDYCEL